MAKARKTRHQKELADKRRFSSSPSNTYSLPEQVSLSSVTHSPSAPSPRTSLIAENEHVKKDLLHTLAITSIIIAFQIALLFILN